MSKSNLSTSDLMFIKNYANACRKIAERYYADKELDGYRIYNAKADTALFLMRSLQSQDYNKIDFSDLNHVALSELHYSR